MREWAIVTVQSGGQQERCDRLADDVRAAEHQRAAAGQILPQGPAQKDQAAHRRAGHQQALIERAAGRDSRPTFSG